MPAFYRLNFIRAYAIFLLTGLLLTGNASIAQTVETHICSYYGETVDTEVATRPADDVAVQIIADIVNVVGLKANFEILEADVPNAAAVIVDNTRYILYNRRFMALINQASGTNWAAISILAHEIGHHLNGHTLDRTRSRPGIELEADEFSGFVLNKMGAAIDQAQAAISVAASQKGSHTHPPKASRLAAISRGWQNANGQTARNQGVASKTDVHIAKPVLVNTSPDPDAIDDSNIAFDVSFSADPDHDYYITGDGELVAADQGELYIVGRLAESNRRGYRLMISDKNYNYLYISGDAILNGSGKKVGIIRQH